jgi:hypothetical protein
VGPYEIRVDPEIVSEFFHHPVRAMATLKEEKNEIA